MLQFSLGYALIASLMGLDTLFDLGLGISSETVPKCFISWYCHVPINTYRANARQFHLDLAYVINIIYVQFIITQTF